MTPAELLQLWLIRNQRVQLAHYESARRFERFHLFLGLPAIGLSTLVGTTVFANLSKNNDPMLQIGVGLLSILAGLLMGLQTFLKYLELGEKHRVAGAKFANLSHRIEILISFPSTDDAALRDQLIAIEDSWKKIREESPTLPGAVWRKYEFADLAKQIQST